jgi:cytochrome b561
MSAQKAYTIAASYYHWLVAAPLVGSVASVLICQQSPKEEKGKWMFRHKSLGLLTGLIVAPRLGYRVFAAAKYKVGHPTGTGPIEGRLADVSHLALYGFMTIMPATGIAMGYYGGKGLPFFWTTIDGSAVPNGAIAKQSFSIHKTVGTYGKFLIPIHVGGALKHSLTGNAIWSRVNPFGRPMH